MSTKKILRWARNAKTGSVVHKAVLLALAAHANGDGLCDPGPSRATLAEETETSKPSVGRALNVLEDLGLIKRSGVLRENGSRGSNAYWLVFDVDSSPQGWVQAEPTPGFPLNLGSEGTQVQAEPRFSENPGVTSENAGGGFSGNPGGFSLNPLEVKEATSGSRARTHTRAREATNGAWKPTPEQLAKTATSPEAFTIVAAWRATHDPHYRPDTYTTIAHKVDEILSTGGSPDAIKAALAEWDRRGDAKPGLLPHLYDDALKAQRAGRHLRAVEDIPDEELTRARIEEILGPDPDSQPCAPRDVEFGPPAERAAWYKAAGEERLAQRRAKARAALARLGKQAPA